MLRSGAADGLFQKNPEISITPGGCSLSSLAVRQIPRILHTPSAGTTRRHHALLVGGEAAISATAIGAHHGR